jgi:hypothetical protein
MDLTKFLTPETPFYIVGLLAAIYFLQRQIWRLEKRIQILNDTVAALHGIHVAAKNCPVMDCPVKNIQPETVYRPQPTVE